MVFKLDYKDIKEKFDKLSDEEKEFLWFEYDKFTLHNHDDFLCFWEFLKKYKGWE